jgi:8-oxo-dGTP pyrophosphatase MutT (NUDIX family)
MDQSAGGHVDEGEDYEDAARREAQEELGVKLTKLRKVGKIYVERPAQDGFIRRFQTIFMAGYDGRVRPDKREVAEVRWVSRKEITAWYNANPNDFTKNFTKAFSLLEDYLASAAA